MEIARTGKAKKLVALGKSRKLSSADLQTKETGNCGRHFPRRYRPLSAGKELLLFLQIVIEATWTGVGGGKGLETT